MVLKGIYTDNAWKFSLQHDGTGQCQGIYTSFIDGMGLQTCYKSTVGGMTSQAMSRIPSNILQ